MENDLNKRLLNIETKLNNLQQIRSIEFFKLFNKADGIVIHLNQYLTNYEDLKRFFDYLQLDFHSFVPFSIINPFSPDKKYTEHSESEKKSYIPSSFDLNFGLKINFQNLYILVEVLSHFGLENIYYNNENYNYITVGCYQDEWDYNPLSKKIEVAEFLKTPFYYSTINFVTKLFNKSEDYILKHIDFDFEKEYEDSIAASNDNYNSYDDDNRDYFNTMTDGQYGDYDDWNDGRNNFDDLSDDLGY